MQDLYGYNKQEIIYFLTDFKIFKTLIEVKKFIFFTFGSVCFPKTCFLYILLQFRNILNYSISFKILHIKWLSSFTVRFRLAESLFLLLQVMHINMMHKSQKQSNDNTTFFKVMMTIF